jgi:hypothetical protein
MEVGTLGEGKKDRNGICKAVISENSYSIQLLGYLWTLPALI